MRMTTMMMKRWLSLVLVLLSACPGVVSAEDEAKLPKVEVYLIRKMEMKGDGPPTMEATVLEISNPTEKTYYVKGLNIESPFHDIEVKRGEKWLLLPRFLCGTGSHTFPFKPGAKMLVTVNPPWDEEASRFRFYFFTTNDEKTMKVVTVRSRAIEKKELGDLTGTTGETTNEKKEGYEEPRTDEEMNKKDGQGGEAAKDPFAE